MLDEGATQPDFAPAHAVRCLKAEGRRHVWLVERPGEGRRTVKSWPFDPGTAGRLLLGIAQPQRQLRGQRRLARAGIDSPAPIGSWRIERRGGRRVVEIELDYVDGESAHDLLIEGRTDPGEPRAAAAAQAIGAGVADLTAAGLLNRDLRLSNLIITGDDPPAVWIIDPVGVRRMRRPAVQLERMLDRLAVAFITHRRAIPRGLMMRVVLAALRPFPRAVRREVVRRLRAGARSPLAARLP